MAQFPVKQDGYRITQGFSSRHLGIDIAPRIPGQTGIKVYAPVRSKVVASGDNPALEGKYLILKGKNDSGKDRWFYFGHFASKKVKYGQTVRKGAVIGIMGETGLATSEHTHHEIRKARYGGQYNPLIFYREN